MVNFTTRLKFLTLLLLLSGEKNLTALPTGSSKPATISSNNTSSATTPLQPPLSKSNPPKLPSSSPATKLSTSHAATTFKPTTGTFKSPLTSTPANKAMIKSMPAAPPKKPATATGTSKVTKTTK